MHSRILIGGIPRSGKSILGSQLSRVMKIPLLRTDDINKTFTWSAQSLEVASWMDRKGPWIIEGTTVVRAIRKWLARTAKPEKLADVVYWGSEPYLPLDANQKKFADGCVTIWKLVEDELRSRGVEIRHLR